VTTTPATCIHKLSLELAISSLLRGRIAGEDIRELLLCAHRVYTERKNHSKGIVHNMTSTKSIFYVY